MVISKNRWLGINGFSLNYYFGKMEQVIEILLLRRDFVSKGEIMDYLYDDDIEPPFDDILHQYFYRARRRLKQYGLSIEHDWRRGYRLTGEYSVVIKK